MKLSIINHHSTIVNHDIPMINYDIPMIFSYIPIICPFFDHDFSMDFPNQSPFSSGEKAQVLRGGDQVMRDFFQAQRVFLEAF